MNRQDLDFLKQNGYYKFPNILQIEITKSCPLKCKQCYKPDNQNLHMEYSKLCKILDLINGKCGAISLNGGEPLIYPSILTLLEKVASMEFNVYLYSSGFGLNKDICYIIKNSNNIHFYISLNGSSNAINSLSRDGFEYSINAMKLLSNNHIRYGVNWVARHDNVKDFNKFLKLVNRYNATYVSVVESRLTGKGYESSFLSKEDLILLSQIINNNANNTPLIMVDACFSKLTPLLSMKNKAIPIRCTAGLSRCAINYDFSFQPCTHLNYHEHFESIEEYWSESPILNKVRLHRFKNGGLCSKCRYSTWCEPCRATDLNIYDDVNKYLEKCTQFEVIGV